MRPRIVEKSKRERGTSLIEYALLIALIALIAIAAIKILGEKTRDTFEDINKGFSGQTIGPTCPTCTQF
jgi:Flp pilus assembly pilin Flp